MNIYSLNIFFVGFMVSKILTISVYGYLPLYDIAIVLSSILLTAIKPIFI